MRKFQSFTAPAQRLVGANIDTDVIFPARFLLLPQRDGLGPYAFHDHRHMATGGWDFSPARILVVDENFGCGSSREQAVWALADLGVEVFIAPSLGEIFYKNCFRSAVLPVLVSPDTHAEIAGIAAAGGDMTIDIERCEMRSGNHVWPFELAEDRRRALLEGLDEIDLLLAARQGAIAEFEKRHMSQSPWIFAAGRT